jgi:serine/threonine-protein kinase HipA
VIYLPRDSTDASALATAAGRGRVRRIVPGVYTDAFQVPADEWVRAHILALLAHLYPDWFVSHSTAVLGHAHGGTAYISSGLTNLKSTRLPGVIVKRTRQFPYPETVEVDTGIVARRTLTGSEESVVARMSSPLQAVFEVLRTDGRQRDRSVSESQVRGLIDHLSRTDRQRAGRFAERNGLVREYARFREIEAGLGNAAVPSRPDLEHLDVYFYHYRVGRLTELSGNEVRFEYDRDWRIAPSGLPLGSNGPPYEGPNLPAFFDNLLPEGWAEARLQAVHKIARDDSYALLRATPKYLSNVTLRPVGLKAAGITLDERTTSLAELLPERAGRFRIIEEIGADPDSKALWLELRRRGATGLSGVQAKLPVHLFGTSRAPHIALGHLGNTSTHILKLPSHEYAELVPNEWATMELARRVGLDVADVRQVTFQSGSPLQEPGLLIERFDLPRRLPDAEALLLLEDAASLLGLGRRDKYRPSLERIADKLLGLGLDDTELASFYDHVVFSWIAGNGDLHAKNISVLHLIRPGHLGSAPEYLSVRYSPLYDLLNTGVAIRDDGFALPLNGKQNNLRGKDFVVLARRLGWDRGHALDRLGHVAEGVEAHLEPVIAVSGLSPERQSAYRGIVLDNVRAL